MDERERGAKVSPEIYVYATNKNFLNIYDALRIDKVKIEIAGYDPATNKQTGIAGAWLDLDDLRLLIHLVSTRQFSAVLDRGRFEKFGGSERDGQIESRTLLVEWDPGQDNRFARFPYRLTIANGPGTRTQNGAVQPQGEPTSRLQMRLPEADLMKIMLAVGAYVQAYEAANHNTLVAQKVRELQAKMDGRNNNRPRHEGPTPDAVPAPRPAPSREAPAPVQRERPVAAPSRDGAPMRERPSAPVPTPVRERPAVVASAQPRPTPVREAPAATSAPVSRPQAEAPSGLRVVSRQGADDGVTSQRDGGAPAVRPTRSEELRPTGSASPQVVRRTR